MLAFFSLVASAVLADAPVNVTRAARAVWGDSGSVRITRELYDEVVAWPEAVSERAEVDTSEEERLHALLQQIEPACAQAQAHGHGYAIITYQDPARRGRERRMRVSVERALGGLSIHRAF